MSPADRDLVARDPALPALALLLDLHALHAWLQSRWPHCRIASLRRDYLRYKKGTSCLAGFLATIDGVETPISLAARRRDALDKLDKVDLIRGRADNAGSVELDRTLALACYRFPADPALRHLRHLVAETERAQLLQQLGLAEDAGVEVLHYRPARRCVARVESGGRPVAVLKMHRPEAFAKADANAAAFAPIEGLVLPRRIGSSERRGVVATEWVEGQALDRRDCDAEAVGAALARFHACGAEGLGRLELADLRQAAQSLAADIAGVCPALAERARDLALRLGANLDLGSMAVTLHGDFHVRQLVLQARGLALIDLDEAVMGPPEYDLATFLAHEDLRSPSFAVPEAFVSALLSGYCKGRRTVDKNALARHRALALFRLALRPFREQWADWPQSIAGLLDRVETILPPTRKAEKSDARIDPLIPQIEAALDRAGLEKCLRAAGAPYAVEGARMVRHKPGRRCLIAYDLRTADGLMLKAYGKIRAKGADNRTFALHHALRAEGLVEAGAQGSWVPRPLALIPELAMWVQEAASGTPFSTSGCAPEMAAAAIGALHRSGVTPFRRHTIDDEIAILEQRLDSLAARRPELVRRIFNLRGAVEACQTLALPAAPCPVHRDFYQDHLLMTVVGPCLLDLDLVTMGDPAVDIGNFLAHLTELGLRVHGDPLLHAGWQKRFLSAACSPGASASARNVRLYEFLSLVRLIEIADRMPERRHTVGALLDLAEKQASKYRMPRRREA